MAIDVYGPHPKLACLYVELLQCNLFSLSQNYGASCLPPQCAGVSDTYKQQILDAHNQLRTRVASGQEPLGAPGSQPPAANMCKLVSKILLTLYWCAVNYSNTDYYHNWLSKTTISHYILILPFVESRFPWTKCDYLRRQRGIDRRKNANVIFV
jgi:hypothetical protein